MKANLQQETVLNPLSLKRLALSTHVDQIDRDSTTVQKR